MTVYGAIKSITNPTNRNIAKVLGWDINRVTGRVTELVNKGMVISNGTYYEEGDLLTILGNAIGGSAGTDDLLLRVTAIGANRGTVVLGELELDTDLRVEYGGTGRSEFNTNGILYGNGTSELLETAAANMSNPGITPDVATSYQILTVTAAGVPVWSDTLDGGTF